MANCPNVDAMPPVGHNQALPVFLDRDLLQYDTVYAAAGTPYAVFAIAPDRLLEVTGATAADLAERKLSLGPMPFK